jgi:hypothetical protein
MSVHFWFKHVCATLSCVFELTLSACGQPTAKRQQRAHNPFTAEDKLGYRTLNGHMLCYPDEFDVSAVRSVENGTRELTR